MEDKTQKGSGLKARGGDQAEEERNKLVARNHLAHTHKQPLQYILISNPIVLSSPKSCMHADEYSRCDEGQGEGKTLNDMVCARTDKYM